ncbi:ligase-associated DNA damage response DEXH box helicase [Reyranella sp. CPCC 100927]|uniref:ligase-associated DNA damage response DEXH box helicase n=1 Tax=Reyranella sp. CPCC 100927 TaxID=2599616 RepID=UPI003519F5FD
MASTGDMKKAPLERRGPTRHQLAFEFSSTPLPARFGDWFVARGWVPRPYQLDMVRLAAEGKSALLIAPTGAGKTLAGFLPSLIDLAATGEAVERLHTLYISPLKALATDIHRNLQAPIAEMGLQVRVETRSGDTPQNRRERQRVRPPQMLLTTPESLALLLSYPDSADYFSGLRTVVVDELHAIATTKRGHLLALGLARLAAMAPAARFVGLSATVDDPPLYADWLRFRDAPVEVVKVEGGARPRISILNPDARIPWGGHMAQHTVPDIYDAIRQHRMTLVFVNTRAQAELTFDGLWRLNSENLPIGLHHGSLEIEQRRKVEAAMAAGRLRAVVATSSLDLGIDWGDIDLVIQVGAPKGVSRLLQRVGRANHRLDEASQALLAPGNRFEVLECIAAQEAVAAKELDGDPPRPPCLDALTQHILGCACSAPLDRAALYDEVRRAAPFRDLARQDYDDAFDFVATGGYALQAYEKWRRLFPRSDGKWEVTRPDVVRQYRMNVGTIVEQPLMKVKLRGGPVLGEVEETFIQGLIAGDTFIFSGQLLRFEGVRQLHAEVSRVRDGGDPKIPAYGGGRLPLSTYLAGRVRDIIADPGRHADLPEDVRKWLRIQGIRSTLPRADRLLIEGFPRGLKQFLVAYCFEGRNAHQTLGMLLTRRMERLGLKPMGFVATDYVLGIWGLEPARPQQVEALFDEDMLGDDLEAWMDESSMLRRSFRNVAVIAGLIERRFPGQEKSRRQVTFSADLIYDALRRHEPHHILLRATRQDAAWQLADIRRLGDLLRRAKGRIDYRRLDRISPLAVPVLLEIGREQVMGRDTLDELLDEAAQDLIAEATRV